MTNVFGEFADLSMTTNVTLHDVLMQNPLGGGGGAGMWRERLLEEVLVGRRGVDLESWSVEEFMDDGGGLLSSGKTKSKSDNLASLILQLAFPRAK